MSKHQELNHEGELSAWELHCRRQAHRHRMREIRTAAGIILASLATAAIVSLAIVWCDSMGWL
jgi:predicted GNAT superfamily acetyltransferase